MRIFFVLLLLLVFSCSDNGSNGTVNSSEQRKIVFTTYNSGSLFSYDLALNSSSKIEVKKDGNDFEIQGHIYYMERFGNRLYLLVSSAKKIVILDAENYNFITEIEFEQMPKKIAFAENATTAYVIHHNSGIISVIDLTVNEIASEFEVIQDAFFTDIETDGNVLMVSSLFDNSVYIISNKDETILGKLDVAPKPGDIEIMNEDKNLMVVSVGNGKISADEDLSPAVAAYYDLETMTETKSFNIQYGSVSSNNIRPYFVVNSFNDYTLISCENEVLFINSQVRAESRLFILESFDKLYYDISDNLVYLMKKTQNASEIYTFVPSDNQYQDRIIIPNYEITSFLIEK